MATDQDLITQTVHDYFEGWYDAAVARMGRARWKILGALWLPR
jgi:hypothetical protein